MVERKERKDLENKVPPPEELEPFDQMIFKLSDIDNETMCQLIIELRRKYCYNNSYMCQNFWSHDQQYDCPVTMAISHLLRLVYEKLVSTKEIKIRKIPVYVNDCVRVELNENVGSNNGIVKKFLQFCLDNGVYGFPAGFGGMGKHVGYYHGDDKDKIVTFLQKEVNL